MKYTKDSTLKQALDHPMAGEILKKYGVPCLGCMMAQYEMDSLTLGQITDTYSLDLKKILEELNK